MLKTHLTIAVQRNGLSVSRAMDPESDLKSVNRYLRVVQMYKRGREEGVVMCKTMVFLASPPGKMCSPKVHEP